MSVTSIARLYFGRIDRSVMRSATDVESSQRVTLASLLRRARQTETGRRYGFGSIESAAEYAGRVPVTGYEQLRHDVMRMVRGERDILWPGRCRRFAQSSGTSGGVSKYIPLTDDSLRRCHYRGGSAVVARYLANYPDSRLFGGKSLVLGGSYASTVEHGAGVKVGDLSATLIDCINPIANLKRVPSKRIALLEDWRVKLPAMVDAVVKADVRSLSGVPSWMMTLIEHVMAKAGAERLHQVWPGLEVFFHGGISFDPYRRPYDTLIESGRMRYMETYNASEGFFAIQDDPEIRAMMLLTDADVYYEFVPVAYADDPDGHAIPAWEVSEGETYALVITSSNGLWRYMIGDTVRVMSTSPLRIVIAGRTQSYINAFGEEVMVHNADAAIRRACEETGAEIADYTAAPVYAGDRRRGHHQWLIEWRREPADTEVFADALDKALRAVNSDYDAKRSGGIFLDRAEVVTVSEGTFDRYLALTGKLGGQRKVPRLKNDRSVADKIIGLTGRK